MTHLRHHINGHHHSVLKGITAGALGGLVASWTMNQFQALLTSATRGPVTQRQKPEGDDATVKAAAAVSERVFDHELTSREKKIAGPALHYVYGTVMGAVYGALTELSPPVARGGGLPWGAALFVGGDEIAVPLLGLTKPPAEHPISVHASALASHFVYGLTTEMVRRSVRRVW